MSEPSDPPKYVPELRRAALPEILFVPDLRLALGGVSESTVRRAVLRGACGPYVRLGRRLAVRREALLAHLRTIEVFAGRTP